MPDAKPAVTRFARAPLFVFASDGLSRGSIGALATPPELFTCCEPAGIGASRGGSDHQVDMGRAGRTGRVGGAQVGGDGAVAGCHPGRCVDGRGWPGRRFAARGGVATFTSFSTLAAQQLALEHPLGRCRATPIRRVAGIGAVLQHWVSGDLHMRYDASVSRRVPIARSISTRQRGDEHH